MLIERTRHERRDPGPTQAGARVFRRVGTGSIDAQRTRPCPVRGIIDALLDAPVSARSVHISLSPSEAAALATNLQGVSCEGHPRLAAVLREAARCREVFHLSLTPDAAREISIALAGNVAQNDEAEKG